MNSLFSGRDGACSGYQKKFQGVSSTSASRKDEEKMKPSYPGKTIARTSRTLEGVNSSKIKRLWPTMASSKFCLSVAGDTPSSNRLFDAIASHCVPVIVGDEIKLSFEDRLSYAEFSLSVRVRDALKKGHLLNLLRGIERDEWTRMWERVKQVGRYFEYEFPSRRGDAVEMIWREVRLKASSSHFEINRENRHASS